MKRLYDLADDRTQARIDKARFGLGVLPRVNRAPGAHPWPQPHKACLVISADLELAWAWRYMRKVREPMEFALQKARMTRANFNELLDLFARFEMPVTWAVVGHLFLEECSREHGAPPHPGLRRVPHFRNEYWEYMQGDWFDGDPCSDYLRDPAWYAPDLIRAILHSDVRHEIACHTFSHVPFSDDLCSPEVARDEIAGCRDAAGRCGVNLRTFVFPANLGGNLESLQQCGIAAYRCQGRFELDVPRFDPLGLVTLPGGISWETPPGWSPAAWIPELRRCVDRAIETGTALHLWFHPSCTRPDVTEVLPALLEHVQRRRNDLWITTMSGLADRFIAAGMTGAKPLHRT